MELDIIVGSGGVLSHAPRRSQAAHMMMDAFLPEGVTELAVDSIFMMPHLGVLAEVHEEAAIQVFEKDCLIRLGSTVCPVGKGKEGKPCVTVEGKQPDGSAFNESIPVGELNLYPLKPNEEMKVKIKPVKGFDMGAGSGKEIEATLHGGVVGLIIDTRGRPLQLTPDTPDRVAKIQQWTKITEFVMEGVDDHGVATVRK